MRRVCLTFCAIAPAARPGPRVRGPQLPRGRLLDVWGAGDGGEVSFEGPLLRPVLEHRLAVTQDGRKPRARSGETDGDDQPEERYECVGGKPREHRPPQGGHGTRPGEMLSAAARGAAALGPTRWENEGTRPGLLRAHHLRDGDARTGPRPEHPALAGRRESRWILRRGTAPSSSARHGRSGRASRRAARKRASRSSRPSWNMRARTQIASAVSSRWSWCSR
jgi:hypothetical protein